MKNDNKRSRYFSNSGIGQDIVMTKWVGLKGTSIIARKKEEELLGRYNRSFIEEAKSFNDYVSVDKEIQIAREVGVTFMQEVAEGGIFRTLWEMGNELKKGFEVDINKILLRQETVEVCEFYKINPYMLSSSGSMIMVTDKAYYLVERLLSKGITAAVIGWIINSKGRIIINGEEPCYLMPPKRDQLYKVL